MAVSKAWRPLPITTQGPKGLKLNKRPDQRSGPNEPPSGFANGSAFSFLSQKTTEDEWMIYWALGQIFSDPGPEHIRLPPFIGGLEWGYQEFQSTLGLSGKTAIDFLLYLPGELVGFRIQTERYHTLVGPDVSAYDTAQFLTLSRYITMNDIYSQDFIEDSSGSSAIRVCLEAMGGRSRLPVASRARRAQIGSR